MLIGGYRASNAAASEVLRAHGYEVEQCRTLSDASTKLEIRSPALVVVDTLVADGDPIAFVRKLRKKSAVPIIVCDRGVEQLHGVEAFEAGADDYVGGSCSCEELALRVHAILGRSGSDQVVASKSIAQ